MSLSPETPNIDRFRSWALAALYGAMTLFSLLLIVAAYMIYPAYQGDGVLVIGTGTLGLATAIFSLRSMLTFISALRTGERDPGVAFMPFVFMTLTVLAASQVFGSM